MPILSDLHQALLDQHLPEADRVAQALDLYVSGSLNVFNHKTNVDIHNRLCLLYTSDAADEEDSGDLGGHRRIKKKNKEI